MAQRSIPSFPMMWPPQGPGLGHKQDHFNGAMKGRVMLCDSAIREISNNRVLSTDDFQKIWYYNNASDTSWTLPASVNTPMDVGVDEDNNRAPITAEGSLRMEIWQVAAGKVTVVLNAAYTVFKASTLTSLRTNGPGTGLLVTVFPPSFTPKYVHVLAIGG